MYIIVPDAGSFEQFASRFGAREFRALLESMSAADVELSMPRFSFGSALSLNRALSALGMSDAFDMQRADFSGMTSMPGMYIGEVIHRAFIKADEQGTEAEAESEFSMFSERPVPVPLVIDRPFIFVIRHKNGQILFMGQVLEPTRAA